MSVLAIDIRKRLPGFHIDVAWEAGEGVTLLYGPSGSGKSLTLSMIAGLTRPDEGSVSLGGDVLSDGSDGRWVRADRRRIGYMTQDALLFPHMSVRHNVEYGLPGWNRAARRERAAEVMERLGITFLADRRPDGLSGGQRQRVALARVLARRPRLLLLDEPFNGLDLGLRTEMRALVRVLREELRVPVILVTHDLAEGLEMADALVIYADGRVARSGNPRDGLVEAGSPGTRISLAGIPASSPLPSLN